MLRGELGGGRFARGAAGFFDRTKLLHAFFALAALAQLLGENLALAHWITFAQITSLFSISEIDAFDCGATLPAGAAIYFSAGGLLHQRDGIRSADFAHAFDQLAIGEDSAADVQCRGTSVIFNQFERYAAAAWAAGE